jgi:hypothetical protein
VYFRLYRKYNGTNEALYICSALRRNGTEHRACDSMYGGKEVMDDADEGSRMSEALFRPVTKLVERLGFFSATDSGTVRCCLSSNSLMAYCCGVTYAS